MSMMASQITSLTNVYATIHSGADQRNIKAPRYFSTGDRWIPRTKASNAENIFIWWRHHGLCIHVILLTDGYINQTFTSHSI